MQGLVELWSCWQQTEGREAVAECVAVFASITSDVPAAPFFLHRLAIAVDFAHRAVVPSSQPPELKIGGWTVRQVIRFLLSIGVALAAFSPQTLISESSEMPSKSRLAKVRGLLLLQYWETKSSLRRANGGRRAGGHSGLCVCF